MKTKKKSNNQPVKLKKTKIIILAGGIVVLLAILFLYPYFKPRTTVWCYFEVNVTGVQPLRNECVHMKIMSREMDKIDFKKFEELDITQVGCVDSYEEIPICAGKEYFFTQFDLSWLSSGQDVDGTVCAAYSLEFYESDNPLSEGNKELYRMGFQEKVNDETELYTKLRECR